MRDLADLISPLVLLVVGLSLAACQPPVSAAVEGDEGARAGTLVSAGTMSSARSAHTATSLPDGRVLLAGGITDRENVLGGAELHDPATGAFGPAGDMPVRRHKHDAVLLPDGSVLITGGTDERDYEGRYDSAETFDPLTGTASRVGPMRLPRYKHEGTSVVLPDGRVLLAGGAREAEVYDPQAGAFLGVDGDAQMGGQFSAAAPLADGRVLVTGGYGEGQGARPGAWLYLP